MVDQEFYNMIDDVKFYGMLYTPTCDFLMPYLA